jgi:hypothetical protein
MCTVTIVPHGEGFRLACNRDEQLTRPPGLPPRRFGLGGIGAMFPTDPASGGTWIGVNDAGIAAALLNRTPINRPRLPRPKRSRGAIVPHALAASTVEGVVTALGTIDQDEFAPFWLVIVRGRELLIATGGQSPLQTTTRSLTRPFLLTSSSLDDAKARRLRAPLFATLVAGASDPLRGQRGFHDHRWPGCPAFSVRMRRPDARTVSRSIVDVQDRIISLTYEPLALEP